MALSLKTIRARIQRELDQMPADERAAYCERKTDEFMRAAAAYRDALRRSIDRSGGE